MTPRSRQMAPAAPSQPASAVFASRHLLKPHRSEELCRASALMQRVAHERIESPGEARYDPLEAPDPQEWLALYEQERISLVDDYHRQARIRLPNAQAHAVVHAIVENQ